MESLLAMLVIALLSAITTWLQKKGQAKEQDIPTGESAPTRRVRPAPQPEQRPAPETASPPPRRSPWEEELRRLLEGEVVTSSPSPPPVIIQRSAPPPVPTPARLTVPAMPAEMEEEGQGDGERSRLVAAEEAYSRAQQLRENTANRLRQTGGRTTLPRTSLRRGQPSDVATAVSSIKNPKTVRQAVIVTLILAPPKALEV